MDMSFPEHTPTPLPQIEQVSSSFALTSSANSNSDQYRSTILSTNASILELPAPSRTGFLTSSNWLTLLKIMKHLFRQQLRMIKAKELLM